MQGKGSFRLSPRYILFSTSRRDNLYRYHIFYFDFVLVFYFIFHYLFVYLTRFDSLFIQYYVRSYASDGPHDYESDNIKSHSLIKTANYCNLNILRRFLHAYNIRLDASSHSVDIILCIYTCFPFYVDIKFSLHTPVCERTLFVYSDRIIIF